MATQRDPRAIDVNLEADTPVKSETVNVNELIKRLRELERQVQEQQVANLPRTPGYRVSPKGAVSVYGIHANFPVTLYGDQWKRIFEHKEEILEFIEANKDLLDFRDDDINVLAEKQTKRELAGIVPRTNIRQTTIQTASNVRKAA